MERLLVPRGVSSTVPAKPEKLIGMDDEEMFVLIQKANEDASAAYTQVVIAEGTTSFLRKNHDNGSNAQTTAATKNNSA